MVEVVLEVVLVLLVEPVPVPAVDAWLVEVELVELVDGSATLPQPPPK